MFTAFAAAGARRLAGVPITRSSLSSAFAVLNKGRCALPSSSSSAPVRRFATSGGKKQKPRSKTSSESGPGKKAKGANGPSPPPAADGAAASSSSAAASTPAVSNLSSTRGPVSWASLVLLLATGSGLVVYYNTEREKRKTQAATSVVSIGKAALGGPWELVDSKGKFVTDEDLKGQYRLMYFGFTYCPDICPDELVKLGKVLDKLDAQKDLPQVTPIFVSLDPNRDTVAQMELYKQDFHPRLMALTGTPAQIGAAAKAFRVYFSDVDREEDDDDYVVDHSIVMYFLAPDGEFIDFYTQMAEVDDIADRMATSMRSRRKA